MNCPSFVGRQREQAGLEASTLTRLLPQLSSRLGQLPPAYPLPAGQARLQLYEAVGKFLAANSWTA